MSDKIILGKDCEYSADSSVTQLNNNVSVVGGSGSGKTKSVVEATLLATMETSMAIILTKRRLYTEYSILYRGRNYNVIDLNFANPRASGASFDPMAYVASYADITFLAKCIVKANPQKDHSMADPFWDDSAISLMAAFIAYAMMTKEHATLAEVLEMLGKLKIEESGGGIRTNYDREFAKLEAAAPGCFAVSCWKSFCNLPIKTAGCVYGTLNTTIDTLFSPELREMMAKSRSVDFEEMAKEKTALFVTTSPVNPSLNCFVSMFYSQMFKSLFEFAEECPDGRLPRAVHVIADDFATGSRVLNFPECISIFREKGISVTILLQSQTQLEEMYGSYGATTILNNCDSYVYMGGMDLRTAQDISLRLNVPLDEVLYMPIGKEIVFRRGAKPVVTERYDVRQHPEYTKLMKEAKKRERGQEIYD